MKITCPTCDTRYDVEEERFLPDGRSVRCAECDESWFVPAPDPIDDLAARRVEPEEGRRARKRDDEDRDAPDDRDEETPRRGRKPSRSDTRDEARDHVRAGAGDAADSPLFTDPPGSRFKIVDVEEVEDDVEEAPKRRARARKGRPDRDEDDDLFSEPARGQRDSRNAKDRNDDDAPRARKSAGRATRNDIDRDRDDEWRPDRRARLSAKRDAERRDDDDYDDETDRSWRDSRPRPAERELRVTRSERVVDVDFEDVDAPRRSARARDDRYDDDYDDDYAEEKGFGRRLREERRRSTALAPIEDLDPLVDRIFDDAVLAAMRVQPKEMERALRKARRRAESRYKNRLTPMAALGWSALVGVVGAVAFVGYRFRDDIVSYYPKTADAYQAVGIDAYAYGLRIENVAHRIAMATNGPTIEITGRLTNQTDGPVTPPLLLAEALGPGGELLSRWTFSAEAAEVDRGSAIDFSTRAPAPEGVAEVALSFAPAEGVRVSVDNFVKPASR